MLKRDLEPLLLFDDDCGICTTYSHFISRLLGIRISAMHQSDLIKVGYSEIGEENYWKSFHVVINNKWYTEKGAIIALSSLFPLGRIVSKIVGLGPILFMFDKLLKNMQMRRSLSCKV